MLSQVQDPPPGAWAGRKSQFLGGGSTLLQERQCSGLCEGMWDLGVPGVSFITERPPQAPRETAAAKPSPCIPVGGLLLPAPPGNPFPAPPHHSGATRSRGVGRACPLTGGTSETRPLPALWLLRTSSLILLKIILFIYLWLCWVFIAMGFSLHCGARAPYGRGFSCCGARALERRLGTRDFRALERRLRSRGTWA